MTTVPYYQIKINSVCEHGNMLILKKNVSVELKFILRIYNFHYFAYGSNMSARRIRHRLGWAPSRIATILPDYQLAFDKQSNDGGKANIQFSSGNFEICVREFDTFESF